MHHKVLLSHAHVAVVNVESQAGRMWRRINSHRISVHAAQSMLVLFSPEKRTHRQRARKLSMIRSGNFFKDLHGLGPQRAEHVDLERLSLSRAVQVIGSSA